jgi:hypothetical protein
MPLAPPVPSIKLPMAMLDSMPCVAVAVEAVDAHTRAGTTLGEEYVEKLTPLVGLPLRPPWVLPPPALLLPANIKTQQ